MRGLIDEAELRDHGLVLKAEYCGTVMMNTGCKTRYTQLRGQYIEEEGKFRKKKIG